MSSGERRQTPPPDYPEHGAAGSSSSSSAQNPPRNPDEIHYRRQPTADTTIETTSRAIIDPSDPLSEVQRVPTNRSRLSNMGSHFDSYSMSGGRFGSGRDHSHDHLDDD